MSTIGLAQELAQKQTELDQLYLYFLSAENFPLNLEKKNELSESFRHHHIINTTLGHLCSLHCLLQEQGGPSNGGDS